MTIRRLYVAFTGTYTDTRVNVFTSEQMNDYYVDNFDAVTIDAHTFEELMVGGYGGREIMNFAVTSFDPIEGVKALSILLK